MHVLVDDPRQVEALHCEGVAPVSHDVFAILKTDRDLVRVRDNHAFSILH